MFTLNFSHLFVSVLAAAALMGCGGSEDESQPAPPIVKPDDEVVFFDDFDSFNSAYWSKETHEAGWTNQELQAYRATRLYRGE